MHNHLEVQRKCIIKVIASCENIDCERLSVHDFLNEESWILANSFHVSPIRQNSRVKGLRPMTLRERFEVTVPRSLIHGPWEDTLSLLAMQRRSMLPFVECVLSWWRRTRYGSIVGIVCSRPRQQTTNRASRNDEPDAPIPAGTFTATTCRSLRFKVQQFSILFLTCMRWKNRNQWIFRYCKHDLH